MAEIDDASVTVDFKEGPIEPNKSVEQIRQTPYGLHKDFRWATIDLSNPNEVHLYSLSLALLTRSD